MDGGLRRHDEEASVESQSQRGLVSLALGAVVLETRIGSVMDNRRDYGETRINALGPVNHRLFVCTYTVRGEIHRLISVRKASRQEQNTWLR